MQKEQQIDPVAFIESVTGGRNLAEDLPDDVLALVQSDVVQGYEIDKDSMSDWLDKMQKAIELAKLVKEDKEYPFTKASNIKYPLVTTAALQFNARAYPAIVAARDVVKCETWGEDPQGTKAERGKRVSSFMSWQLLRQMDEWDEDTDRLTLQLAIVGDMFRKVWPDGRAKSKLAEPGAVIVNANAPTLQAAPRITEELRFYPHEIETKIRSGWFKAFDHNTSGDDTQEPHDFIEQSCRYDLDEDGYPEPYLVTVHCETQTIVRMVADFEPQDVQFVMATRMIEVPAQRIVPDEFGQPVAVQVLEQQPEEYAAGIGEIRRGNYWVHYRFMPGMGRGLLSTGFGILLGDISAAVNASINQLFDAGHYASLGGGFIGGEFRLKGGAQRFRPGEWKQVSQTGGDIRSAMVPMTYPGPDQTMFAMLGMLIDAGKEVSSTKDILTGDTGTKNMTATTTLALIEQGMKVFTACYKRIYVSLSHEFRMIAAINAQHVTPQEYNAFLDDEGQHDPRADFTAADMDIVPVADPEAVTRMQQMGKAQLLMEMAGNGLVSAEAASKRILEAAGIEATDELLPQPDPMQQQMQAMGMQAAQADLAQKMADLELTMAKVEQARADAYAKVSGVERDDATARYDRVMKILEMQRDDLARSFEGSVGGMARPSGNGEAARNIGLVAGPPQGRPIVAIPGGQAGFGGQAAGLPIGA